jgi:hypothetical protein
MHVEANLRTRPAIVEIPPYMSVFINSLTASVHNPIDRQTLPTLVRGRIMEERRGRDKDEDWIVFLFLSVL